MQMENFENIRLPWPDWKIVKDLGGGTYGRVYEIERTISGIQEKAALKIVSRPKNKDEMESYYNEGYSKADLIASYKSEIQNYVQEYKLMKELQGESNIVSCDDFTMVPHEDEIGGDIFIRMELLTSLQQILRERSLSEQEIIKLGKDISHALVLCESKNIIHRDIKPANIMVSQFGNYKLGDFGVSKIMDHATFATSMGTPEYQAPEIVHMERYGQAADIYSLGITLYWLLNNRRMPFIDANQQITLVMKNEAIDRRYRGEKLPAPKNGSAKLKKIVLKACEYHPENRYASAQEMYDALDALENGKILLDPVPVEDPESTGGTDEISMDPVTVEDLESTDGQTGGNSWSDNGGTIGSPGRTKKPNQPTGGEQKEPNTVGPWSGGKKDPKQPKGPKQPGKDGKTGEVIAEVNKPKYKRTAFGYVWNILIIGLAVWIAFKGMTGTTSTATLVDIIMPLVMVGFMGISELIDLIRGYDNYPDAIAVCRWITDGVVAFAGFIILVSKLCEVAGIDISILLLDLDKIFAIKYVGTILGLLYYLLMSGVILGGFIGGAVFVSSMRYKEEK